MAVVSVVALNISVQPVQLGLRTLIVKTCHPDQQTLASAWAAQMTGGGNIIAQMAGSVDLSRLKPLFTESQLKNMCLIASLGLMLTLLTLIFIIEEDESPIRAQKCTQQHKTSLTSLQAILAVWRGIPQEVIIVWKVQFLAWMDFAALSQHRNDSEQYDSEIMNDMRIDSLKFGAEAMLLNACVAFSASLLLPALWGCHSRSGQTHNSSYQATLSRMWVASQVLFGVCMIALFWAVTMITAMIPIGLLGISWACTSWIPSALVSTKISQDIMRVSDDQTGRTEAFGPGLVMSLHNVSIAGPQILAALIASFILYTVPEPSNPLAYVLGVGGVFGLIGAWMASKFDTIYS
ncbi:MFS general substrate transporter [Penicillium viridicatum]|nr:MFS general substrate transporter [Penicillium viridicatum]